MKNLNKILFSIFLIAIFMIFFFYDIKPSENSFEIIATFLSIFIGFCFTALSIITTSKFSKILFSTESKSDNSKTLLHELIDKFKYAIINSTICIILIIIYFSLNQKTDYILISYQNISLKFILSTFILFFNIISFYYFFKLLNIFLQFVIKESSN